MVAGTDHEHNPLLGDLDRHRVDALHTTGAILPRRQAAGGLGDVDLAGAEGLHRVVGTRGADGDAHAGIAPLERLGLDEGQLAERGGSVDRDRPRERALRSLARLVAIPPAGGDADQDREHDQRRQLDDQPGSPAQDPANGAFRAAHGAKLAGSRARDGAQATGSKQRRAPPAPRPRRRSARAARRPGSRRRPRRRRPRPSRGRRPAAQDRSDIRCRSGCGCIATRPSGAGASGGACARRRRRSGRREP